MDEIINEIAPLRATLAPASSLWFAAINWLMVAGVAAALLLIVAAFLLGRHSRRAA